jgi:hypothetical protein
MNKAHVVVASQTITDLLDYAGFFERLSTSRLPAVLLERASPSEID